MLNLQSMKQTYRAASAILLVVILSGCANVPPWERGDLANRSMRLDTDSLESGLHDHVWFSREAATGGRGIGGGGCGCN